MTQTEFMKGWTLLILQPWGWRYRGMTQDGRPSEESKLQLEFYFDKLKSVEASAWWHVASLHAQGDAWPSVREIKISLNQTHGRFIAALPAPDAVPEEMPDAVRAMIRAITQRMGA